MNNIICVKWGSLYSAEFVNNLYAMCKRNLTDPFNFYCITNKPSGIHNDIIVLRNEDKHLKGWWQKIIYFKNPLYNIEGPVLALDLDLIVVNNIDCFFSYKPGDFVMKHDKVGHGFSSCVMRFEANQYPHIYDELDIKNMDIAIDNSNRRTFKQHKFWGDQIYITHKMTNGNDPLNRQVQTWPKEWIPLFGRNTHRDPVTRRSFFVPPTSKIIAFAGWQNDNKRHRRKIQIFWHSKDLTYDYRR